MWFKWGGGTDLFKLPSVIVIEIIKTGKYFENMKNWTTAKLIFKNKLNQRELVENQGETIVSEMCKIEPTNLYIITTRVYFYFENIWPNVFLSFSKNVIFIVIF